MEKTVGMRVGECRVKMGMTQEELAMRMCAKKSTISAYELDKIDIKVGVLRELAPILGTTAAYLADDEVNGFSIEGMQIAMFLEEMQNQELRRAAMGQVRILVWVDEGG